jgi:hypothetical protein
MYTARDAPKMLPITVGVKILKARLQSIIPALKKAIDAMNLKQWKGRTLALEFSVPKGSYEAKVNSLVQHTNLKREEAILPKVKPSN